MWMEYQTFVGLLLYITRVIIPMVLQIGETIVLQRGELEEKAD
jgi:hypothetical protein